MKRRHPLAQGHRRQQQNVQGGVKDLPQRDLRTIQSRQRNTGLERGGYSLDPVCVCSSSDGSVNGDRGAENNQALTSLPSGPAGLTGISEHVCETQPLTNGNPAPSSRDTVFLLDSGEDEVPRLELETRQTSVTTAPAGKTSLAAGAGETWEACRPSKDVPGQKQSSDGSGDPFPMGTCAGFDSRLDDSLSEVTVISGPSSPHSTIISLRCRECKSLFSRMRRQRPTKPAKRNYDPAALSCDNWLLNKAWHPQRQRKVKGRLWVHLKRIRKLALERSDGEVAHPAQCPCSRPHVFLQRNLRRCRERSATLRGACEGHTESQPRRRHRVKSTRFPFGTRRRRPQNRGTSLQRASTVQHPSTMDLTVDGGTAECGTHPASMHRPEKALEKGGPGPGAAVFLSKRAVGDDLEGTRRVLKFDSTPSLVTIETRVPKQDLGQEKSAGERLCEGQADLTLEDWDAHRGLQKCLLEDSNGFRTPLELSSAGSEVVGSEVVGKRRLSCAVRNHSFKSMLAGLKKSHNRIIKETDK